MDEEESMELALNSNFDSVLLDCWEEATRDPTSNGGTGGGEGTDGDDMMLPKSNNSSRGGLRSRSRQTGAAGAVTVADSSNRCRFDRFPSFTIMDQEEDDDDDGYNNNNRQSMSSSPENDDGGMQPPPLPPPPQHQHHHQGGMMVAADGTTNATAVTFLSSNNNTTQLHPLAIQATAKCPPNETSTSSAVAGVAPVGGGNLAINPSTTNMTMMNINSNNINTNNNPTTSGGGGVLSEFQQHNAALLPLAMNALAAGATIQYPIIQHQLQQMGGGGDSSTTTTAGTAADADTDNMRAVLAPKQQQAQSQQSVPPFLLFDAPIELRTNFQNAQRAQGLPVFCDNNAYHFGIAVNGFHPQNLPSQQQQRAQQAHAHAHHMQQQHLHHHQNNNNVRLIDARHGDIGEKRIKNAKEQKRAQRITELIDELRTEMEKGGWDVGHKSKFNTLSSCANYVKHLVKITKEKERAVQKARCDLEAKRSKIEADKAQQDPSDPESTTSTMTVSSSSATDGGLSKASASSATVNEEEGQPNKKGDKKRSASSGDTKEEENDGPTTKKPCIKTHESTLSSSSSSGGDDISGTKPPPGVKRLAMDHTTSCVSDITESNKGSSSNSDISPQRPICADEGKDISENDSKHKPVRGRKRKSLISSLPTMELTSLAPDFEIDYEEVFVKSNVPQCIATTAGKIVSWNEFFLKATGLSKKRVGNSTIFNLVQTSKLSNLFEIVAKSLRSSDPTTVSDTQSQASSAPNDKEEEEDSTAKEQEPVNYEAMTLPCIKFPTPDGPSQLYITVTLMPDEDPRKRCFHCLLTDNPCTNGEIGPITPELLGMLFKLKHKHHHSSSNRKLTTGERKKKAHKPAPVTIEADTKA